jgi:hypothetical protein
MALMYITEQTIQKVNDIYYKSLNNFLGILANDPKFFLGKKTQEELYQEFIVDGIKNKHDILEIKKNHNKVIQEKRKQKYISMKFKSRKTKFEKGRCIANISKDGLKIKRCSFESIDNDSLCHVHIDSTLPYGYISDSSDSYDSSSS